MKTRKFNQYYFGVLRSAAIVAGVVCSSLRSRIQRRRIWSPSGLRADAPLPASSVHGATQLAQDDGAAAGAAGAQPPVRRPTNQRLPMMRPWCSVRAIA